MELENATLQIAIPSCNSEFLRYYDPVSYCEILFPDMLKVEVTVSCGGSLMRIQQAPVLLNAIHQMVQLFPVVWLHGVCLMTHTSFQ